MDGCLSVRRETRTQPVYDCERLCSVVRTLWRKRGSIKPEHKPAFCPGSQRRHASYHGCSSGLRDIDGVTELYRSYPGVLAPCFADKDEVLSYANASTSCPELSALRYGNAPGPHAQGALIWDIARQQGAPRASFGTHSTRDGRH